MNQAIHINLINFLLIYLLLIIVLFIMKRCHINQTKQLIVSSMRMTVQLVIAGLVLTYIFKHPHPLFTVTYIIAMCGFATYRVLSKNKGLNIKFRRFIILALALSGVSVITFFVTIVVKQNIFNPRYVIPLSGMVFGNMMTGLNLGIKTFREQIDNDRHKLNVLLNYGINPNIILRPYMNNALETALLPILNNMVGMGIVSLPGMMTGQILSGTMPMTAILYQISMMIAICTAVCLAVFIALYLGYHTFYNDQKQFIFE